MAKSKPKAKVTGGMDDKWISKVRANPAVSKLVSKKGLAVKRKSETDARVYSEHGYGYRFFFGSTYKTGSQGRTFILWPTNWLSMSDPNAVKKAIDAEGLESLESAKGKRKK